MEARLFVDFFVLRSALGRCACEVCGYYRAVGGDAAVGRRRVESVSRGRLFNLEKEKKKKSINLPAFSTKENVDLAFLSIRNN